MEKIFKFGQLLEKSDVCNRTQEIKTLKKWVASSGRGVVFGPRRFGKTSILKNVILTDFKKTHKEKGFAFYCDLFQVKSLEDFRIRFQEALEIGLSEKATFSRFVESIKEYLSGFQVQMEFDPLTSHPILSLKGGGKDPVKTVHALFKAIQNLSQDHATLLILDEFQDIVAVDGLESKLREELQSLTRTSVILSGSKNHVLREMIQNERRPFYAFGSDLSFGPIPSEEWLGYLQERFAPHKIRIHLPEVQLICSLMGDVPNAIQEYCSWIVQASEPCTLTETILKNHLSDLLKQKSSRYHERLREFSEKESRILLAIAVDQPVASIGSTAFITKTQVSATAVRAATERLINQGVLDRDVSGVRITDPLFRLFLVQHARNVFA